MKIEELVQRVKSRIAGGVQTESFPLSTRHIYSVAVTGRALLLEQKSKKKQKLSEWNYQTLPYVEMERISEVDCDNLGLRGCKVLRSKHQLPRPLLNLDTNLISEVVSVDRMIEYKELNASSLKYQSGNKYTKNIPGWFVRDRYLYISYTRGPKVLRVVGVFGDPIEASKFPCPCKDCGGIDPCLSYPEREFYLDESLIPTVIDFIEAELLGRVSKPPQNQAQNQAQEEEK